MEKVFSHAWRGRHGTEIKRRLDLPKERQTTLEAIQVQYIDDDQVIYDIIFEITNDKHSN